MTHYDTLEYNTTPPKPFDFEHLLLFKFKRNASALIIYSSCTS